jgi:signal transduction histidine kinase
VSFRSRLLIAFAVATLLPLGLLAFGVRVQVTKRVLAQHQRRVDALARVAMQDLGRESASIDQRLDALAKSLADDNRFRLAVVAGAPGERNYLLDYAGEAMRLTGLSMLQLQDESGRILSSGHFRNEFDRLEPELPALLAASSDRIAIVATRTPESRFLSVARLDSVTVGGRRFTLVGGVAIDAARLARFARDSDLAIALVTPEGTLSPDSTPRTGAEPVAAPLPLVYIDARANDSTRTAPARLVVSQSLEGLDAIRRDVNRLLALAIIFAAGGALLLGVWLSSGLSRPLAALARATSSVELQGPDVELTEGRDDEIGRLARRFGAMTRRLRASAARLRDAERRATVGDMARQVNHDIKNGLIPIRNVLRHLTEVQEHRPLELSAVFGERRATLESSIGYLDNLARNYGRLTPRAALRSFDVNDVVQDVARSAGLTDGSSVQTRLAGSMKPVLGDPVLLRRILDNLLRNAIESLPPTGGKVFFETAAGADGAVRIVVADTGRGMTPEELSRAFDDFFSTKEGGTGLGLSVVRRLVADLGGTVRVESNAGRGTSFTLDLPAASPRAAAKAALSQTPTSTTRLPPST